MQDVRELVEIMFTNVELFKHLGSQPPRGVLLHGPPGCGKTLLAHAVAGELGVPFFKVSAPALVGGHSGDSERSIRNLFKEVTETCISSSHGCLVFIDEIDVITPKRETSQREMERRMVAQLLSCLDELSLDQTDGKPVLVMGATNRPDSIDPALRRAGRFDREISIPIPNLQQRENILRVLCNNLRIDGDFDIRQLAQKTPGYVGADLTALVNEASLFAVSRAATSLVSATAATTATGGGGGAAAAAAAAPELDGVTTGKTPTNATASASSEGGHAMEASSSVVPVGTPAAGAADAADAVDDGSGSGAAPAEPVLQMKFQVKSSSVGEGSTLEERAVSSKRIRAQTTPFTSEQMATLFVTLQDFEAALPRVQPSAKREGFATVPEVTWDDVGALAGPRRELEDAAVLPLTNPELCRRVGIPRPPGVLLYGPPGCGKTLLAKAVANGSHANFISIKGPELLNKYVGESERAVRQVFQRARASSPCIIFFDELDALCPKRENDSNSRGSQRLVNQLLTEMDGFEGSADKQIFVIAATNRPDIIDQAMLRPGRLDKLVYVDIPSATARAEILLAHTRKLNLGDDVVLTTLAEDARCTGFTGADLAALVREAGTCALRRLVASSAVISIETPPSIVTADFEMAFGKVFPSVSPRDLNRYRGMQKKLRGARAVIQEEPADSRAASPAKSSSNGGAAATSSEKPN